MSSSLTSTSAPPAQKRIAVIGAGPVGLEAALYAVRRSFTVRVFEMADEIAPHERGWRHLPLFSCWDNLRTPVGCDAVRSSAGADEKLPGASVHPTAEEFIRRYLEPASVALPPKSLWLGTRVVAVTRPYGAPHERSESPIQAQTCRPLRLLTRASGTGEERSWSAEYVLDCTAGGRAPAWLGPGGIPAIGEMGCTADIYRYPPDILGRDRATFAHKKTLLVGDGPSAASSANLLAELAKSHEETQFFWAVAHDRELPCSLESGEAESPRRALELSKANLLVKVQSPFMAYSNKTSVEEIRRNYEAKKFFVTLQVDRKTKRYQFDNIIANIGARREAPYLNRVDPGDPCLFLLGASEFDLDDHAIRRGHRDIVDAFKQICSDPELDLYQF